MLHWIRLTDHKLVRVSLRLDTWAILAGYWKFNTPLLEIGDFWERQENLIQWVLVGVITGNKWWGSLKYRITDFAIKYGRQLKLDRTKKVKSSEDRFSWTVERRDSLAIELARRDLEREASERYKSFVVITRLKRVSTKLGNVTHSYVGEKYESFPIGTSSSLNPRMSPRYGRTSMITLPVFLTPRFRGFAAI